MIGTMAESCLGFRDESPHVLRGVDSALQSHQDVLQNQDFRLQIIRKHIYSMIHSPGTKAKE